MMKIQNLESFDKSILCMIIMAINMNHHMVTIMVLEVLNALKRCSWDKKKILFMNLNLVIYVETFDFLLLVLNFKSDFFLMCIINIDLAMLFVDCVWKAWVPHTSWRTPWNNKNVMDGSIVFWSKHLCIDINKISYQPQSLWSIWWY